MALSCPSASLAGCTGLLLDHCVPGIFRGPALGSRGAALAGCLAVGPSVLLPLPIPVQARPSCGALWSRAGMGEPPRPRTLGVGADAGAYILARWPIGRWRFRTTIPRYPYALSSAKSAMRTGLLPVVVRSNPVGGLNPAATSIHRADQNNCCGAGCLLVHGPVCLGCGWSARECSAAVRNPESCRRDRKISLKPNFLEFHLDDVDASIQQAIRGTHGKARRVVPWEWQKWGPMVSSSWQTTRAPEPNHCLDALVMSRFPFLGVWLPSAGLIHPEQFPGYSAPVL